MIDLRYLNDITDSDEAAKRQIILLFFAQADEIMRRFAEARRACDVKEIGHIAHLAKSTSKIMGISDVSSKMEELQRLADSGEHPERYPELIDYYLKEIPLAIEELKKEISI